MRQIASGHLNAPPQHRERLAVPWWAWPAALAAAVFLGLELTLGASGTRSTLIYAGLVLAAVMVLLWASRIPVQVEAGELRVDDARLPVRFIAGVSVLDRKARQEHMGPEADPLAFVIQRPWVPGTVRIDLNDPADPTPYWIISSRRPESLAATLLAARDQASSPDAPPAPGRRPD